LPTVRRPSRMSVVFAIGEPNWHFFAFHIGHPDRRLIAGSLVITIDSGKGHMHAVRRNFRIRNPHKIKQIFFADGTPVRGAGLRLCSYSTNHYDHHDKIADIHHPSSRGWFAANRSLIVLLPAVNKPQSASDGILEARRQRPHPVMPNPNTSQPVITPETEESFGDILSQFEQSHVTKRAEGTREGTVVSLTADSVVLDIGFKTEGILPLSELQPDREPVKRGDKLQVSIKGRDPEGYYLLTRSKAARPRDWSALERAFAEKAIIVGTVTGVVKGGLSVDVGVRAFMPASRSGARDAAEMEKLIEQEIRCRIIKLDAAEEDVVVDRRAVAEEEERAAKDRRYSELKEGDVLSGTVRSLTDYGAFVDIGGADALLHVGDISWSRVNSPADALAVDQQIEVKVLGIDVDKRRISVGLKQLLPHPWDSVGSKYNVAERVRGTVTRLTDFGAFVELEPGIEGLIHVSEMSWVKKIRRPSDLLKTGDAVEAIILGVNPAERRMSLGLKQALGDPWADA